MGITWGNRGIAVLLILIVIGVGVGSAGKMNPITSAGYVDVRDSPCWTCHVTWAPPLREMVNILPPTDVEAAVGEQFDYTVRIQNAWIAEVYHFEPSVDITDAPSLEFVGGDPPILGNLVRGVIGQGDLPISSRSGVVVIQVEAGTTDLHLAMTPSNTDPNLGPVLTMNIFPQQNSPQGTPAFSQTAPGPGQTATVQIQGGAEIAELGFGNWTIEARVQPAQVPTLQPGAFGELEFAVQVDKYFNASEERVQFLSRELGIGNGLDRDQSQAFTWTMRVVKLPEVGERLRVAANTTSYYDHDDSTNEDLAYVHRSAVVPITASAGGASFGSSTIVVDPGAELGVSMARISEVIGYISAFLVIASIYTGGMFGKATRRQMNRVFQSAKRRVAFHNFLSYGILLAAVVHTVLFVGPWEGNYHWTLGLIWGGIAILSMVGLGLTGALQVPMIRRWNYAVWRWSHFGLAIATIVFTLVHIFLDGGNWGTVQSAVGWQNPLDPR